MPRFTRLALVLASLACAENGAGPVPDYQLGLASGRDQVGAPWSPLAEPIVIDVRDPGGAALPGVSLRFEIGEGGGRVLSERAITDRDGRAAAVWLLGDGSRPQRLRVIGPDGVTLTVAAAIGSPPCAPAECAEPEPTGPVPFHLVTLATFDGSGQAVHPDLLPRAGAASPLAMVFTPYPFGNAQLEDPSLVESGNGRHWRVPAGVVNPLARSSTGHLSDPDVVRDPGTGVQHLYFREVTGGRNRIHLLQSDDGIGWRSRGIVLDVASHRALSPAVVRSSPVAPWSMWSVNSGGAGCSAQATTVERRDSPDGVAWGDPVVTDLAQPGQVIWHLDVQWVPSHGEYWALYNSYPVGGSCVTRALFLARSDDGIHWSVPERPLLAVGSAPAFEDVVYRGTFRLSTDGAWFELVVSGADHDAGRYTWTIGRLVLRTEEALGDRLDNEAVGDAWRRPGADPLPPPEPFDLP